MVHAQRAVMPEYRFDSQSAAQLTGPPLRSKLSGESIRHTRSGGLPVNRNELVDTVAGKTELRKAEASKAVDAVFDAIAEALKGGDEVRLVGFGTFSVASRAASEGRNPRTGEKIKIAASKQAKFKPGKGLRDSLN
jgi:DNA-binding protein HU-beta